MDWSSSLSLDKCYKWVEMGPKKKWPKKMGNWGLITFEYRGPPLNSIDKPLLGKLCWKILKKFGYTIKNPVIPSWRVMNILQFWFSECFCHIPNEQWKKAPGCLGYTVYWIILPSYMGIIINHDIRIPIKHMTFRKGGTVVYIRIYVSYIHFEWTEVIE